MKAKQTKKPEKTKRSPKEKLNAYIAHAGVCSRRNAALLVKEGKVTVNHATVADPSYEVKPTDQIRIQGKLIKKEQFVYILLNKPKGMITSVADEQGRPTIMTLVEKIKKRIYPVGRLDKETSGLLLLTNDGDLAQRLAHPKFGIKKVYRVVLDRGLTDDDAQKMRMGVRLRDGKIKIDDLKTLPSSAHRVAYVAIHSGKYRIIRRLFEHFNYNVLDLDRTQYASLSKHGLKPGQWRQLKAAEIEMLKNVA